MTKGTDQLEGEVAKVVAAHAGVPVEQVGPSTRLWHDLRLAGEDFADVIEDLNRTHGVTLSGRLGDYCPTEGDMTWAFWWRPFKRNKTYRELTVTELAAAAHLGANVG